MVRLVVVVLVALVGCGEPSSSSAVEGECVPGDQGGGCVCDGGLGGVLVCARVDGGGRRECRCR